MNSSGVHNEVQGLLSAYLDGELTQAEAQRVRIHVEDCRECARELNEMSRLRTLTAAMPVPEPPDARMDELERSLSVSAPRQTAWVLICSGLIAWVGYLVVHAIRNLRIPEPGEALLVAVITGVVLLFISVARQRMLEYRHDRYRRVKR